MQITHSPQIKDKIEEITDKIYKKYNIYKREQFEQYCKKMAIRNNTIDSIMKQIKNTYLKSLRGESTVIDDISIPEDISAEVVLETKKKISKEEVSVFVQFILNYEVVHGKVNPQDMNFQM